MVPASRKPRTCSRNSFRPSRASTTGKVETINFHLSTQPPLGSCDHSQAPGRPVLACSNDERVAALIKWEMTKNFTTGFVTGLGGIVTLPVGVPSALGASWLIQARMAGAIARIYGHDLAEERVRTLILLSLAGDVAKQAMSDLGLDLGSKLPQSAMKQVPGRALVEINKRIGLQLLTKAGQRGLAQFPKAIPVVGGVVGGAFDAVVCRMVGRTARKLFRPVADQ